MAPPNHQVARRQLSKAAAYTLAKIQPFKKWTPKPISFARSRFGVNMVPSIKGKFILLRPSPWLPAIRVVRTTVPTNPKARRRACSCQILRSYIVRWTRSSRRCFPFTAFAERERRVDETDVCERLREVPECRAGVWVYLFCEEAHVVRVSE